MSTPRFEPCCQWHTDTCGVSDRCCRACPHIEGKVEHVADPAKAHIRCGQCGAVVALAIPVLTTMDDDGFLAYVDQETGYGQELWDHALNVHGPSLDGEVGR